MRKFVLGILVILAVAVGAMWWLLSDANRFKAELIELIASNTGLQVAIDGNLSWRLWPPVQLVAEDVRADWSADATEPLLRARTLRLSADLWQLLNRNPKLVIQGATFDGLHAHLMQQGTHANWMPPDYEGDALPPIPIPPPASDDARAPWEVANLAFNDAVIDYTVDGATTRITIDALHTSGIAPEREFPLFAKLVIDTDAGTTALNIVAKLQFDSTVVQWQVAQLDLDGLHGALPFNITATADFNSLAGTFALRDTHVQLGEVKAQLALEAVQLLGDAQFKGRFDLPQQSLDSIAALLGVRVEQPLGLQTDFVASNNHIEFNDLQLRYADSLVSGTFGTATGPRPRFEFKLKTDRFVIPQDTTAIATLGAGSFATLAFAAPAITIDPSLDEPLLPLQLILSSDWQGTLAFDQLTYAGATFDNATVALKNIAGDVDTTVTLPKFFDGRAIVRAAIDARYDQPKWRITPELTNVNSTQVLAWLDHPYDWVALFLAGGELTMQGNTRRELTSTLAGHASFDGGKGVLNIAEIKRQALAVAALAGGTELINAWPERLNYQRFIGTWATQGTQQKLDAALDNLALTANGTVDALANNMDVAVTITVQDLPQFNSFKVSPILTGLPLPVRCRGSLDAPTCAADQEGMRKLLAQAITGGDPQMKAKLNQAIDERVPEEYRDAARSLLEMLSNDAQPAPPAAPAPAPASP